MLKGSPFMLNSDHKPIARAPSTKENEKPTRRTDEKTCLFAASQTSSDLKPDFMDKFESRKRGQMSSATSVSTVAQSQSTADTTLESSRAQRKRVRPACESAVKVGVKRKSDLSIGKYPPQPAKRPASSPASGCSNY